MTCQPVLNIFCNFGYYPTFAGFLFLYEDCHLSRLCRIIMGICLGSLISYSFPRSPGFENSEISQSLCKKPQKFKLIRFGTSNGGQPTLNTKPDRQ